MVKQLEKKLQDVDLVSLRRIQVIEVLKRDFLQPEDVEQCVPAEEPSSGECKAFFREVTGLGSTTATGSCSAPTSVTSLCDISCPLGHGNCCGWRKFVPQHFSGPCRTHRPRVLLQLLVLFKIHVWYSFTVGG